MALSTTQSLWRSGGGDTKRVAYCGSTLLSAQFYIADASVATAANVVVSSATGAADLVLPKGAVVVAVVINDAGTGHVDLGTVGYASGTATTDEIAANLSVASAGFITSGLANAPLAEMSYVTAVVNADGSGTAGGYLLYFVEDTLLGQQNV